MPVKITELKQRLLPPLYPCLVQLDKKFNQKASSPEILYLGDSVVERTSKTDEDIRSLGDMVVDALSPKLSCVTISHSAYHPLVYYNLVAAVESMTRFPMVVILPINMRCFSPQWDLQPYWQFDEEIQILKNYQGSAGKKIGRLRSRKQEEIPLREIKTFNGTIVNYPLSELDRIGQFVNLIDSRPHEDDKAFQRKREIFIFHYTYPLSSEHRKIFALRETIRLLHRMDVSVFAYLTPINVQAGERFAGSGFKNQLEKNVQIIKDLVKTHMWPGMQFADWSSSFDSREFLSEDLATEHLNQSGRQKLSSWIVYGVFSLLGTGPLE